MRKVIAMEDGAFEGEGVVVSVTQLDISLSDPIFFFRFCVITNGGG